jgi:hypothetical protein
MPFDQAAYDNMINLIYPQARQSLGLGSPPFQPISLSRYSQALGEAGRYAAWLAAVRRELEASEAAVTGACDLSTMRDPACCLLRRRLACW